MREYDWPGNVRELENVIECGVILSNDGKLHADDALRTRPAAPSETAARTFDEVARQHILGVLERTGWRIEGPRGAAAMLALHPNTLRSRMKKLGIVE